MTSSDRNGHGSSPLNHDGVPMPGPGETTKGQPAFGLPLGSSGTHGVGEGSVSALRLPADFQAAHFLDPAFLAGLANELFAEGMPTPDNGGDFSEAECLANRLIGEMPEEPRVRASGLSAGDSVARAVGSSAANTGGRRPLDFHDPRLFLGIVEDLLSPPAGPGTLAVSESATYYFLQGQPETPPMSAKPAPAPAAASSRSFHVEAVRRDFPILHQTVHGKPLIWLDNAATTQKPRQVLEALTRFYEQDNSNIHRAAHTLAGRATDAYESARDKVRRFLGASQSEEIVFVRGATEGINLVAQTFGRTFIGKGDEIVLTEIEHHANIVPWQQLARDKGAVLRVAPVNDRGEVLLDAFERLLGPRTKFVALTHVSNALGTVLPVRTLTALAHRHGARVLIDGAQSVPHTAIDVQHLDCDFFVFSGHKLFAPTGIGVLYGKRDLLEAMPPWQGGGNMIEEVTFEHTTYQQAPMKFEAGTGILAGAVGLGAAIDYLDTLGMANISRYEHELLAHASEALARIPGLRLIGTAAEKASVVSFVLEGVRTEDMGRYLDGEGIAVRAGHHCAQPTMRRFGVTGTVRPSLAFYNTHAEIDALAAAVRRARSMVG